MNVISRRKVPPAGECIRSVCPAHSQYSAYAVPGCHATGYSNMDESNGKTIGSPAISWSLGGYRSSILK